MKFYRVHFKTEGGTSAGFEFFVAKAKAKARKKAHDDDADDLDKADEIEPINVEPTRAGILAALNAYAAHAENG